MRILGVPRLLSWLLLPVLVLAIAAVVLVSAKVSGGRESVVLLTAFNVLFCSAPGFVMAFLGARSYLLSGSRTVLLVGAGGLVLALAYLLAGPLLTVPNEGITVHNISLLVAAGLFAGGAVCALTQRGSATGPSGLAWWLAAVYVLVGLFVAVLTVLTVGGLLPRFFVPGEGSTIVRQVDLGLAAAGLLVAAGLFARAMWRSGSRMHALVAAGLCAYGVSLAVFVLTGAVPGSPIAWLGRSGQWLGGAYLLIGLFTVDRSLEDWSLSLERALSAVEERYQKLVELSPYGIFVQIDGHCVFANTALAEILGVRSKGELLGAPVREWFDPEYRGQLDHCLDPSKPEELRAPHEVELTRPDGTRATAEIACSVIQFGDRRAVQAIVRDVTVRREAEAALRESEDRFRRLVEGAPVGIFIQSGGEFAYINHAAEELFRATPDISIVGRPVVQMIHPDHRDAVLERMRLLKEENRLAPLLEETILRVDGTTLDVEVTAVPFEYDGENGALVFITDITERRRAAEALARSEEQLRQSQKMEAVGQLAGGVAHDFNNLLTAIVGYGDLILARGGELDEETRSDVLEIRKAADRASGLTRQILAFSRKQALRPEIVCLNDLLADMGPMLRRTLGEDVDLVTLLYADLGLTEIDVHQFEQVLINLAVNARDAMPEGGRLTLETANVELSEEYCLTHPEATPGSAVMLGVSDTGTGMDTATLSHIFEPFFTTKAPGAGTGLGLSTVYGIVRQSGGSIFVYSEPGQGTSFKIYLPRIYADREAVSVAVEAGPDRAGGERILVVEDEAALSSLITRVLGDLGYEVLVAGSGQEAMDVVADGSLKPDLLLTDVVLPGQIQGNHLAKDLEARWPDLPVLYMSGYTRNAIVHAGRLDEGVHFLEKPFTPGALASKVREVIDSRPT